MTDQPIMESGWFDEETATFGDRLAGAREAAGLDQEELARRLGIRTKTVRAWENDQNEPRANKLQMVAGMLNVSIMWLLTGQGDGLEAPDAVNPIGADAQGILTELRLLRSEQAGLAERMGRLEKRLRLVLNEGLQG